MILCKLTNNWLTLVKNKGVFVWEENRARDLLVSYLLCMKLIYFNFSNKWKIFFFLQLAVSLINIRFYTAILTELIIFITICTKYKTLFQRLCEVLFCGNLPCVKFIFFTFTFCGSLFCAEFFKFLFFLQISLKRIAHASTNLRQTKTKNISSALLFK